MPSFNPLGGITGRTSCTLFQIRLENDFIVLRGGENEASDQILKGTVVLCLPAPLKVEDVHLKLTGVLKIGWNDQRVTAAGVSNNKVDKTSEIMNYKWDPFVGNGPGQKAVTLEAGNYEWPFEFTVQGTMFESVEGLPDFNLKYKLKATVARGKLAYDLHAYKAVRIVRTLDPSALELTHAMTVENIWPNKVEYQLIIPTKAVVFGTHIDIDMRFTSLLKGLDIGKIKCVLVEMHDLTLQAHSTIFERTYKHTRDIDSWEFQMTKDANYTEMMESGQDGWSLKEKLPLPKSLSKCLQNVEIPGVHVRHKVKFNIALNNPDGHTSELRATLPVTIFISPNMPLNEEGCLVDQSLMTAQAILDSALHAPPLYGEHVLDQLYAGFTSGLQTPHPQSGVNTPFYAQSRSGSSENIASLDGAIDPTAPIHPDALASRLHDLSSSHRNSSFIRRQLASGGNTPRIPHHAHVDSGYFGTNNSAEHSTQLSRRPSEEDDPRGGIRTNLTSGQQTPEHIDHSDFGDLSKVPSYNTAVRAPVRGMSYSDAVPNYETAVSTPGGGFTNPPGVGSPTGVGSVATSPSTMRINSPPLHTNDGRCE